MIDRSSIGAKCWFLDNQDVWMHGVILDFYSKTYADGSIRYYAIIQTDCVGANIVNTVNVSTQETLEAAQIDIRNKNVEKCMDEIHTVGDLVRFMLDEWMYIFIAFKSKLKRFGIDLDGSHDGIEMIYKDNIDERYLGKTLSDDELDDKRKKLEEQVDELKKYADYEEKKIKRHWSEWHDIPERLYKNGIMFEDDDILKHNIVFYRTNGKRVQVKIIDKEDREKVFKGRASCLDSDKYDEETGFYLAYLRALKKYRKEQYENTKADVKMYEIFYCGVEKKCLGGGECESDS